MSRFNLQRSASPAATVLLCLLPLCLSCGLAHAAESKKPRTKAAVSATTVKTIHWPVISWGFKDSLTWLRDTTVNGLLPRHTGAEQLTWDDGTALQFDVERELFKSIHRDALKQQSGLQVGSNTQFQWDVQRYWTVNDRQEVAVKLGLHFDFR